jgi:hypothetical protein
MARGTQRINLASNVARKGYILDEHEPGVIHDDAIAYIADAGARTFDFKRGPFCDVAWARE